MTVSAEPAHSATAASGDRLKRPVQRACDRCTQGVMDVDNPHLSGACECPCHRPIGPESAAPKGVEMSGSNRSYELGEAITVDEFWPLP